MHNPVHNYVACGKFLDLHRQCGFEFRFLRCNSTYSEKLSTNYLITFHAVVTEVRLFSVVFDFLDDFRHLVVDITAFAHEGAYLFGGVHNGGVVSSAENLPNLRK